MDGERVKKRHIFGVLVAGLFIGICLGGSWLCQTSFVLQIAQRFAKRVMAQQFSCCFDAQIESVSLWQPTIVCRQITVTPLCGQARWHWCCERLKIHLSLAGILFSRCAYASVECDGLDLHSQMDGEKSAIVDHIKRIIASPDMLIPVRLKSLLIHDGRVHAYDVEHNACMHADFDLVLGKNGQIIKANTRVRNGQLICAGVTILSDIQGHITGSGTNDKNLSGHVKLCARCVVLPGSDNFFCFEGKLTGTSVAGRMHNTTRTMVIDSLTVNMQGHGLHATASGKIENICVKNIPVCGPLHFDVRVHGALAIIDGLIVAPYVGPMQVVGQYNVRTDTGLLSCHNIQNFVLKSLDLPVQAKQLTMAIERSPGATVAQIHAQAQRGARRLNIQMNLADDGSLTGFGNCDQYTGQLQANIWPRMSIDNFQVFDDQKKCVCQLRAHYDTSLNFDLTGQCGYFWPFVPAKYANWVRGDGFLQIVGDWKDQTINLDVSFERGSINIPHTGNMLTECHARVTVVQDPLSVQVSNLCIELDQGRLECACAYAYFNDRLQPIFVHIPLVARKVLTSVFGLAARVSAGLLVTKGIDVPQITIGGAIFIDKAVASLPAFFETNKNMFMPFSGAISVPIVYQFTVQTRGPVSVKMPTLQADMRAQLRVSGTCDVPVLNGLVRFESGRIYFPHAVLDIDHGALSFAGRCDDRVRLDMHAHGFVQNYHIYLRASGLPEQPVIQLSSSPGLSQERIASVLITGSSQQMLNSVALAMVLDGVRHAFQGVHSSADKSSVFAQALKKVRLAPQIAFSENGTVVGGGLSLDWDDRLQAIIRKNFSFKNDASFEVNYQLADEIQLKAFSDQHGGIGGQLQMRLKF